MSKRPAIVPIFQNGLQKSPLEKLGFPFSLAFSHKELMVPFSASSHVLCQHDEVSPVVHHPCHAKWSPRYPHVTTQQAASVVTLLIWAQRGILNDTSL